MKKLSAVIAIITILLGSVSCGKYTDIQPKGKNLLNNVDDLDLLMNHMYGGSQFDFTFQSILVNDMYYPFANVPNIAGGAVKDITYVVTTYDEGIDRAALTLSDYVYEGLYGIVSRVANIVIQQADQAEGDRMLARQLKAEAYVLRAYMHYLLVNVFAKAYDPATASKEGGIPYVKQLNLEQVQAKRTMKEVYDFLLEDVNAAIDLEALPAQGKNSMRIGKSFAYAVKARILMSMRDYEGALAATNEALKFNNVLEDHRIFLSAPLGQHVPFARDGTSAPDNLFYAYFGKPWPLTFSPSIEIINNYYEPGNIILDSTSAYNFSLGEMFLGMPGVPIFLPSTGNYEQNAAGMTTSDLYMMKAECLIRLQKVNDGMDVINEVRKRRVAPYQPATATNEASAMTWLKKTARIEFLYTVRNFIDIKRWNAEGTYKENITKTIGGKVYELKHDSKLWVFPFPQNATEFNPTLTQNY